MDEYRFRRSDLSEDDARMIDSDPSVIPLLIRMGAYHVRMAAKSDALVLADIERSVRATLATAVSRLQETVHAELQRHAGAGEEASRRISGDVCKAVMSLGAKIDADPTAALVSETMRTVQSIRDKLLPSRDKGCVGEMLIGDMISSFFPEASVDGVGGGKQSHSGDFLLRFPGVDSVILVECKLWDRPCPRAEIDKCFSDMRAQGSRHGLMVNLKSGFAGKSCLWSVEKRGSLTLALVGRAVECTSGVVLALEFLREMARGCSGVRADGGDAKWMTIVREIEEFNEQERCLESLLSGVRKMIAIGQENVEREADKLQRGLKRRLEALRYTVDLEMREDAKRFISLPPIEP